MEARQSPQYLRVQESGPIRHASGLLLDRQPRSRAGNRSPAGIRKVGQLVWSPLAGGLLSGKFSRTNQKVADSRRTEYDFPIVDKERTWKILDVMAPIAKAHGCSSARLSLAWLLARPVVTSVIIGAKRLDQLQDNLAAVGLTLTQDELGQLDEVSALSPEYPGWVLPFQGPTVWSSLIAGSVSPRRARRIDRAVPADQPGAIAPFGSSATHS
jgi:hypothetical protein